MTPKARILSFITGKLYQTIELARLRRLLKAGSYFRAPRENGDCKVGSYKDDILKEMEGEEAAKLGKPSYLWRAGQERRLEMVRKYVPLEGKKILDFISETI